MSGGTIRTRPSVRAVAVLLIACGIVAFLEGGSRLVFSAQGRITDGFLGRFFAWGLDLDPYEMLSPEGGYHWVLRPGYRVSTRDLAGRKRAAGRHLGARAVETAAASLGNDGNVLFQINAEGFKGPALDPARIRPRILALGDSTTFGIGANGYPRTLERELHRRGVSVEVVNGGVEGYSIFNVLRELERFRDLRPGITTLFIGWNSLFSEVPWPNAWENRSRFVWLAKRAYRSLRKSLDGPDRWAARLYGRAPTPDADSPDVTSLDQVTFRSIEGVARFIDAFDPNTTTIVLVTLPGLFTTSQKPSPRALEIGHLPFFTDNPYVLATLTEKYNAALRDLAARRDLDVIDLERWSVDAFQPREAYFFDSVHLTSEGLDMIGRYMASELMNRIEPLPKEWTREMMCFRGA